MMPLIGFKKKFADLVQSGDKTQTIRAPRKRPIKEGDRLYLYVELRTKQCRKLGEAICMENTTIWLTDDVIENVYGKTAKSVSDWIAKLDGFADYEALKTWFGIMPYEFREMNLIRWRKI